MFSKENLNKGLPVLLGSLVVVSLVFSIAAYLAATENAEQENNNVLNGTAGEEEGALEETAAPTVDRDGWVDLLNANTLENTGMFARVFDHTDGTDVYIYLDEEFRGDYSVSVRSGTCSDLGGELYQLDAITNDFYSRTLMEGVQLYNSLPFSVVLSQDGSNVFCGQQTEAPSPDSEPPSF